MNITFAITTDYKSIDQLKEVIGSIDSLNITNYEILIIGEKDCLTFDNISDKVRCIKFDETVKPGWTTRKKNILCQEAQYENIVLMHDYYLFDENWYVNMEQFSKDVWWDICCCQHLLINGKRHFTDWVTWDDPIFPRYSALPYDEWSRTQFMYISGGLFMVKKQVTLDNPFNENLVHGQAEDVEWSLRVRDKYRIVCNGGAIVRHNKVHRDAQ